MKIFLAGASGVIGRSLLPRLIAAGHDVTGMTGDPASTGPVRSLGARPVVIDAFDRDRLAEAIRAEQPDAVMHQLTSLRSGNSTVTNRLRTEGTRNLVDAALSAGVRTVVAQSYCIYAPGPGLADETDPLAVNSPAFGPAAEALATMETIVSEAPHGVLLRYGNLYGPGTGYASNGAIAAQVRRGELPANADVTSFLHLEDAADAALQALEWPAGPVNIVDDEPAPGTEWLPVYAAAIGAGAPPEGPGTDSGLRGAANSRARKDYGWELAHPSWREGFRTALG
jgi:nucleoside-diphosphate-sugar epimerase